MPRREAEKRTRRARLTREGQEVTIRTYSSDSAGPYEEGKSETANSPYTVNARVRTFGRDIQKQNTAEGEDFLYGLNVWIRDDADPLTDGVLAGSAEDRPASTLETDGQDFHVVRHFDLDDGLVQLIVELNAP